MNRYASIKRPLTAIVLLCIFLLIHAGKVLHTHAADAAQVKLPDHIEQVKKTTNCAICDYQIAKDAVDLTAAPEVIPPSYSSSFVLYYESRTASSVGLSYADRGPPAHA